MLDRLVETPVGAYLHRAAQEGELSQISVRDERLARALGLLFILNFQRIGEAKGEPDPSIPTLAELEAQGDGYVNRLADAAFHRLQFRTITLPDHLEMFFTEAGAFPLPITGRPALVMPLGLRFALVSRAEPIPPEELRQYVQTGLIQAFSLGVGTDVHRVVLPPFWTRQQENNEDDARDRLRIVRLEARKMCEIVAQASCLAGLG